VSYRSGPIPRLGRRGHPRIVRGAAALEVPSVAPLGDELVALRTERHGLWNSLTRIGVSTNESPYLLRYGRFFWFGYGSVPLPSFVGLTVDLGVITSPSRQS
jgi:hypothetical protein